MYTLTMYTRSVSKHSIVTIANLIHTVTCALDFMCIFQCMTKVKVWSPLVDFKFNVAICSSTGYYKKFNIHVVHSLWNRYTNSEVSHLYII